ncbi:glycosyltransferase [Geodermatophilus sp. SYSU D00708]
MRTTERGRTAVADGTPSGPRLLLGVAPLTPAGGVDTLLTAFGLLAGDRPGLVLEVVGGGPLGRDLRCGADHLGLDGRVRFCGALPRSAVRAAVGRNEVLVLPHRRHDDREHLVPGLLDAFAAGRPVVATRPVADPLLVRHGETGLVVPPGDAPALASALADLLDHPDRAGALAAAGESAAGALPAEGPTSPLQRLWQRVTG